LTRLQLSFYNPIAAKKRGKKVNYEILRGIAKRYLCVYIPPGADKDKPPYSIDYVGGLYGFAVRSLGVYEDAWWFIGRAA